MSPFSIASAYAITTSLGLHSPELSCLSLPTPTVVSSFSECRRLTDDLSGKTLSIAYLGGLPNVIQTNPPGGSDFQTVHYYRQKLGFDFRPVLMNSYESNTGLALIQEVRK